MLNWIWLFMVIGSVLVSLATGTLKEVSGAVMGKAEAAVMNVMLPMAGVLVLWMGIMRLVERSGLIRVISRALRPVMTFLFPDIPRDHPVMGSIAMNLGATMIGAGNAATPMGLRAMEQLRALNPNPGVASNAMCMFLALNTSGITLIPMSTMALLAARKAANPGAVILPSILTTICATIVAVIACKLLQRLPLFRAVPFAPDQIEEPPAAAETAGASPDTTAPEAKRMTGWRLGVMWLFVGLLVGAGAWFVANPAGLLDWQRGVWAALRGGVGAAEPAWFSGVPESAAQRFILIVSVGAIPAAISFFVLYAALAGLKVYEEVIEGAKDGMNVTLRVIPYVVAILVAVGMFQESGALRLVENAVRVPLAAVGFPVEVLPMAIIRPLSGGAARGVLDGILTQHGPDSMVSQIAATINGSTETTFYVAALYFGSARIRRMRHAIPAGLLADAAAMIFAVIFCKLLIW